MSKPIPFIYANGGACLNAAEYLWSAKIESHTDPEYIGRWSVVLARGSITTTMTEKDHTRLLELLTGKVLS